LKIEPPAKRNRRSFINWVSDENPLYRNENKYLENGEDFIALADLPDFSWLDLAIGRLLDWGLPRNVCTIQNMRPFPPQYVAHYCHRVYLPIPNNGFKVTMSTCTCAADIVSTFSHDSFSPSLS